MLRLPCPPLELTVFMRCLSSDPNLRKRWKSYNEIRADFFFRVRSTHKICIFAHMLRPVLPIWIFQRVPSYSLYEPFGKTLRNSNLRFKLGFFKNNCPAAEFPDFQKTPDIFDRTLSVESKSVCEEGEGEGGFVSHEMYFLCLLGKLLISTCQSRSK